MNFLFLGYGPITSNFIRRIIWDSDENAAIVVSRTSIINEIERVSFKEKLEHKDLEHVDVVINSWKSLKSLNRGWEIPLLNSISNLESKKITFVNLSSVSVYGECPFEVDENSALKPINEYGVGKLEFENYLKLIRIPNLINLRISNVFGDVAFDDFLNRAFRKILERGVLEIVEPSRVVRDFIAVEKVVSHIENLLNIPFLCKSNGFVDLNVSGGKSLYLSEVLKIIEESTGEKLKANIIPPSDSTILESRVSNAKLRHLIGIKESTPGKEIRTYIQGLVD